MRDAASLAGMRRRGVGTPRGIQRSKDRPLRFLPNRASPRYHERSLPADARCQSLRREQGTPIWFEAGSMNSVRTFWPGRS